MEINSDRLGKVVGNLLLILFLFSSAISVGHSKPVHPELEATDICIFTCDFCFTGEALVRCANECIMLDGTMGPLWRKACPYFGEQPIFSPHKMLK